MADLIPKGFERLLYFGMDRGVPLLLGQLEQHRQVFLLPLQPFPFLYRFFDVGLFLADAAGVRGVVPKIRRGDPGLDFLEAVLKAREVKDASEVRSFGS
jgi:hypothetical protein